MRCHVMSKVYNAVSRCYIMPSNAKDIIQVYNVRVRTGYRENQVYVQACNAKSPERKG